MFVRIFYRKQMYLLDVISDIYVSIYVTLFLQINLNKNFDFLSFFLTKIKGKNVN